MYGFPDRLPHKIFPYARFRDPWRTLALVLAALVVVSTWGYEPPAAQAQRGYAEWQGGLKSLSGPVTVLPGETVEYVFAGSADFSPFAVRGGDKAGGGHYTVAEEGDTCTGDCIALLSAFASAGSSGTPTFGGSDDGRWGEMGGPTWETGSKLVVTIPATAPGGSIFEVGAETAALGWNWVPGSTRITTTVVAAPGAPGGFSAIGGDESVTLSWTASADNGAAIGKYQYQQDGGAWTDIPHGGPGQANAVSYTVSGLTNGQSHTFRLRAVNAGGNSNPSNTAMATPNQPRLTPAPIGPITLLGGDRLRKSPSPAS